jgi:hypothetical protein
VGDGLRPPPLCLSIKQAPQAARPAASWRPGRPTRAWARGPSGAWRQGRARPDPPPAHPAAASALSAAPSRWSTARCCACRPDCQSTCVVLFLLLLLSVMLPLPWLLLAPVPVPVSVPAARLVTCHRCFAEWGVPMAAVCLLSAWGTCELVVLKEQNITLCLTCLVCVSVTHNSSPSSPHLSARPHHTSHIAHHTSHIAHRTSHTEHTHPT